MSNGLTRWVKCLIYGHNWKYHSSNKDGESIFKCRRCAELDKV